MQLIRDMNIKNLMIPFTFRNRNKQVNFNLIDYPLFYYKNKNAQQDNIRYCVRILFWAGMVGHGTNYKEAFLKLKESFEIYKSNNTILPKPWEKKELEFASTDRLLEYESFAVDFFDKILAMDFYNGFFSDESCLDLFYCDYDDDKKKKIEQDIVNKVKATYGVDIQKVYNLPLPDLFKYIIDNRKA